MINDSSNQSAELWSRRTLLKATIGTASVLANSRIMGATNQRSAIIIGAGIAGLSAAHDLTKAGFAVRIFEKSGFAGGRMREAWMGPLWGPPHALGVFQASHEMFALAAQLGIAAQFEGDAESDSYDVDNGHGIYSTGLRFRTSEIARIPGISQATIGRLSLLQPDLDEIRGKVDPCLLHFGASYDDESIAEYYRRKLGADAATEVLNYWIDVVLAAWGWPAESTSKIGLLSWFSQNSTVRVPKGGIGVLTSALADLLKPDLRTTVRYVSPPGADGKHTVYYLTARGELQHVTPDVVVVATEGKYVSTLVQGLDGTQSNFFDTIEFTKAAGVTYVLDADKAPPAAGGGYTPSHPDLQKRRVSVWAVTPGNASDHHRPPTAMITLSRDEVFRWQVSGQNQQTYCLPLLQALYPAITEDMITDAVVMGCDDLIYLPVGYVRKLADIVRRQQQHRKGLYFAGEFMAGAHTGAACASGRSVARTIIKHWS